MTATPDDFTTLLERGRQGDRGALTELAQRYESKLRLVARVLLGPALRPYLDSVDLVQSVHRSLLVGLRDDKFDIASPENLLALALTMVRRKVARHWRHLRRQQRLDSGSPASGDIPGVLASLSSPPLLSSTTSCGICAAVWMRPSGACWTCVCRATAPPRWLRSWA